MNRTPHFERIPAADSRIRILHIVDNWGMGGLQNGIANLVARLDPNTFEHIIGAIRPVKEEDLQPLTDGKATVLTIGAPVARLQLPGLARAIRELSPDIVHSRNWASIEAVIAARWTGGCVVIHGEHGVDYDTKDGEPWRRRAVRRLAFEMADRVLSVSCVLRDLHAQRTGFAPDRISVIHNGVDTSRFAPDARVRARVRQQLGIGHEEFCIGCVGNLTPVKDHVTVLRSLTHISPQLRFRLLLVGDGPEREALTEFAHSHREIRDCVTFIGRSQRVSELLNVMDVYILPSVTEGICNSLLEAMATGLPVVATKAGGNPEIIVDRDSGLLFPVGGVSELGTHLLALHTQHAMRLQLGQQGLQRSRSEFSIASMVAKYDSLYRGVRLRGPRRQHLATMQSERVG